MRAAIQSRIYSGDNRRQQAAVQTMVVNFTGTSEPCRTSVVKISNI